MSCCTFLLIEGRKIKLISSHYSTIQDIITGVTTFEDFRDFDLTFTDTKHAPAFIVVFDEMRIYSTNFNWFIDVEKEAKEKGWEYIKGE